MQEINSRYFMDYYEPSTQTILTRNVISYVSFLISITAIDLSYYLLHEEQFTFIIFKTGYNLILILMIIWKYNRIRYYQIFVLFLLTKILSIILQFLGRVSYFSIFLLFVEEIEIQVKPWQHFLEKLLIKIGFLAFMVNQQSLLDIFIGISLIIQEIEKIIYILKFQNYKEHNEAPLNNSSQDPTKAVQKFNKLQLMPCFKISKKQKAIIFSDQSFQVASTLIDKDQNIDAIVLEKIDFYILDSKREDKFFEIFPSSLIHQECIQDSISNHSNDEQCRETNIIQAVNLKTFIINHELKKQDNSIHNQYYEFIAKCQWNENTQTLYSGQIFIQDDDDEVILQLIDITKQCQFQEKLIKEELRTAIVKSFSHELRTPLNSSLNFLQYCESDKTLSDEIKQNFISPAINALRLQSYLISDIIDFCQLSDLELDIQSFSIQQVVNEVNKIFKSALQMKNLALYFDLTKNEMAQISTDYSRFMQILANVIQNSIKYSNQGGMILIKITSPSITYLKLTITDEGLGIDETTLQKINYLIKNIQARKFLPQFDTWIGFGISITTLLLQRLKPEGLESFKIKSNGRYKGTKVSFLIRNYITTNQLSSIFKETKKQRSSKFAVSIHSTSKNHSMNGSIVQLSDPENCKKCNLEKIFMKKTTTHKIIYQKSQENSCKSNSIPDINFELKIGEFRNLYPFQHTEQTNSIHQEIQQGEVHENQIAPIIQYEYLKNIEEEENEIWLKNFLIKNCTCKKVLSVDDDIFNQKSIQFLLRQKGIDVILAYNGQEAISIIKQQQKCCKNCRLFIFILMDYQMPIMNGPSTTKVLVEMMKNSEIPIIQIIGLTAFNSKNDIECCLKSGMKAVLQKPLQLTELFQILQIL